MALLNTCSQCGVTLGPDARAGLCLSCLSAGLAEMLAQASEGDAEPPTNSHPGGDDPDSAPARFGPGRRLGSYELLEEVGRGGMGVIFKARQPSLRRLVAVKLLRGGHLAEAGFVRRFRTEATAAGMLKHPHIVGVHEVGIHEDQHYIVMDFVQGRNLAVLCAGQPLVARRAARYVQLMAEAIHYAHERGVLHRDLKPANVLIDQHDQPRITDFGLAKRLEEHALGDGGTAFTAAMTVAGQVLGSPNYMPPEQASSEHGPIGRPCDVYSLGAILYHLLTGRPPFVGETLSGILHQVGQTDPTSPRLLHPATPRDLETICLKCLEKQPARRYPTARALAEDLDRFLADRPIQARPASSAERLWKWCRRNRRLAVAGGCGLALLVTIAIGSPIAAHRINRERLRAEREGQRALKGEAEALANLYIAQMNLAQQAWQQNNIGRLRRLLDETASYTKRSFEWYYWRGQCRQERRTLSIPGGDLNPWIEEVAFSADGRWILGWGSNRGRIWDATTGEEKLAMNGFRPGLSPDGREVVFWDGDTNYAAVLVAVESGLTNTALAGPGLSTQGSTFSPDGSKIATWDRPGAIRIFDATTGREVSHFPFPNGPEGSLVFSRDGREIITGGKDGTVRILDASSGEERLAIQVAKDAGVRAVFSPDGHRIVTTSEEDVARVWDRESGRELLVLRGHSGLVTAAAFSPDGGQILTGSRDHTARLWDAHTGQARQTFKGHEDWVLSVAFSPQGNAIATGDHNGEVKLWDLAGGEASRFLRMHTNNMDAAFAVFSPDGKRLLAPNPDHTIGVWDLERRKQLFAFAGHRTNVHGAVFSPDGHKVLSADWDGTACLWVRDTGDILHSFATEPMLDIGSALAISHDGQRAAIGGVAGIRGPRFLWIWNAMDGALLARSPPNDWGGFCTVAFSPDDRFIATASSDWVARLWDARTGEPLRVFTGHRNWVRSAAFSPDGSQLVTCGADDTIKLWEVASGRELRTIHGHKDQIYWAEFSPAGDRLLSASHDKTAMLWDVSSGQLLLTLHGHTAMVTSARFSPNGQRIATSSFDGTVRVWEASR